MHSSKCFCILRFFIHLKMLFATKCSMFLFFLNTFLSGAKTEGKLPILVTKFTLNRMRHSQAFMTRSPLISGFQSSQDVSKPSAKRMQKFLKWPLLTRDSEEQAVISVLSMVRTRAELVSKSMLWLA